jgi:RHS repeat-associated protein
MLMPGRTYSSTTGYRYGFNGKENDNEVKGEGNQQDYGMRIYDPRLGKFLSVDPLQKQYPFYTPYQFSGNTPIQATDLDGLEEIHFNLTFNKDNKPQLKYDKTVKEKSFLFFFSYKPTETKVIHYKGESYEFTAGGYSTSPLSDPGANSYEYLNAWLGGGYNKISFDQAFYSTYAKNLLDAGEFAEGVSTDIAVGKSWAKANANSADETTPSTKTNKQVAAANGGKFGGKTIIVDENLSPTIATKLKEQGYNVKTFAKGTTDADILDWAKKNNGAVLTNNIKDFKNRGVMTIEVPVSMTSKNNADKVINGINTLNRNIESHGNGVYNNNSTLNLEKDAQVVHKN